MLGSHEEYKKFINNFSQTKEKFYSSTNNYFDSNGEFSGNVYLMKNNRTLSKKFLVLDFATVDLICYNSRLKKQKLIFLHSLVGCFIEKLEPSEGMHRV